MTLFPLHAPYSDISEAFRAQRYRDEHSKQAFLAGFSGHLSIGMDLFLRSGNIVADLLTGCANREG